MKNLLFTLILLAVISCKESNTVKNQEALAELTTYQQMESEEESTKKFMKDYLRAVNSPDWKTKTLKYLRPNPEDFLEAHTAFRTSFPNYKATIKHLMVAGNEGIVWINVTANFAAPFAPENKSDYGDGVLKGIKAENQALSWDEAWHFNVENGKFADKFDFLKDYYAVLKGLGVLKE